MAIQTDTFAVNPAAAAEAAASAATAGPSFVQPQQEAERQIRFSFTNGNGFEDVSALQSSSVVMTSLKKMIEEKYKDTNMATRVIPMLRESFGEKFKYSSLIITASTLDRLSGSLNVAYHILLIEASNPVKPEPYRNNNNNPSQAINIPRFACDGIDGDYVTEARMLVERSYSNTPGVTGAKAMQAIYASSEVIPDNIPLDNPEKVGAIAVNALLATVSQLKRLSAQPAFNLNETETTPFSIEHIFRDGSITDLNERPVRSDLIVKTIARSQQKRNGFGLNGGADGTPVSLTSLFIDTWFTERANNGNGFFKKKEEVQPCFVPRAIVTNNICYKGSSQEMFLLALYNAFNVYESGAARRSLANKQVKKGDLFDMTDIGALNVLANLGNENAIFGPIYSVRPADVTDAFKHSLLEATMYAVPLMAIDCEIAGPSSWNTTLWQQAAEGGPVAAKAMEQILQAAMNLTDGAFAKYFREGTPLILERQIVPLGYWEDTEGHIRDIREFDTLAMLNRYGADHPEMVSKWINSQHDKNTDEFVRLTQAISVIDDASSTRARHTGRALRATIHPDFMFALAEGIKVTKHTFTPSDMFADNGHNNLRGANHLNWSQLAANAALNNSAFNKAGLDQVIKSNLFSNMFSM